MARWLGAATLIVALLLGLVALQSWRIVGAIVEAERAAVVPLPERSAPIAAVPAGVGGMYSTAATPTASPAAMVAVDTASERPAVDVAEIDSPSPFDVVAQMVASGLEKGDPGASPVWDGKTSLNILVVGVDRRPDGGDQNADVIVIAHLDLVAKTVSGVSLPRDLLIEVPGYGWDKINSAYNHGAQADPDNPAAGIALVRDTIEATFEVPIDGYVLIDFNGFKDVVDAMGGFDIDVPYEIIDNEYPTEDYGIESIHFDAGPQHMDGDAALKYVRTRHADSDDARRTRQMQVLMALFEDGKSLTSIARASKIISAGGKSVQTSFLLEQQLVLARLAMQTDHGNIRLSTLGQPILQGVFLDDGRWAYSGDQTQIVAFVTSALDFKSELPATTDVDPSQAAEADAGS